MGGEYKGFQLDKFPIKQIFSLDKLMDYWQKKAESKDIQESEYANAIIREANKHPELLKDSPEIGLAQKLHSLFTQIISPIIGPFRQKTDMIGLNWPNTFKFFYTTPAMDKVFGKIGKTLPDDYFNYIGGINYYGPGLYIYGRILNEFYDAKTYFKVPVLTFQKEDKKTGLLRNYDIHVDQTFTEIIVKKKLPKLSKEEIRNLSNNFYDLPLLMEALPPEYFNIKGFAIVSVVDSTSTRSVMAIKDKLLEKDAIVSREHFKQLEKLMCSLLGLNDLKLGLGVTHLEEGEFQENRSIVQLLIPDMERFCDTEEEHIHQKAFEERMPVVLNDLESIENKSLLIEEFIKLGFRSLLVIPLLFEDNFVGMLELGSKTPNGLNNLCMLHMHDVVPAFSIAALRVSNDMKNQIKAKIQDEFTAIHSVVEWRFDKAASCILKEEQGAENVERDPIVFKDVFPLYGAVDIRSSSHERNKAIVKDLIEQLMDAERILEKAWNLKKMPVFSQLKYQITEYLEKLNKGLLSGDETRIIEFLKREVEPIFSHLKDAIPKLKELVNSYEKKIHPDHGMLYKKRNDFEISIGMINDTISEIFDEQESSAQEMFPHYFEKYRTDGTEYSIYVGQSLLETLSFDPVYLNNLRLWELIVMCQIARKTADIKKDLPIPLETTQLILVHSNPLDIRFREDEKKFDVEGGYNIRYEIIKKRIDKALIKGTGERLTQPGTIAIIYSQANEFQEYKKYLDYLKSIKYIQDKIENLELEDMQGVFGLQAMRVKVNIDKKIKKELNNMEEIVMESGNKIK